MNTSLTKLMATLSAVAAASLMAACSPNVDNRTAGEKLDATVAKAEQKADELKSDAKAAGKDAAQATERGLGAAADTVKDAAITTAVNGKLVADPDLSALKINVDTMGGKVVLRGSAPSEASREHAATLASSVDGVVAVDNQLVVGSKS